MAALTTSPVGRACFGVALIGCGRWGRNYARILHELPQISLVVVCDFNEALLSDLKEKYPYVNTTLAVEEALEAEGVDACVVATPAGSHFEIVSQCLVHGLHVLVEKPLTLSSAEGQALVDLAEEKDRVVMVGFTFLFNSSVHKMRELIEDSAFGDLYYLHATPVLRL